MIHVYLIDDADANYEYLIKLRSGGWVGPGENVVNKSTWQHGHKVLFHIAINNIIPTLWESCLTY